MGLLTLYNVVSPLPAAQFPQMLSELLEPLSLEAKDTFEREDGSQLVLLQRKDPATELGVWIIPLKEGQFHPAEFDDQGRDQAWTATIRCLCKVGASENDAPLQTVLLALELAATLAEEGRIYDLYANRAFDGERARELARAPFDIREFVSYHYLAPPSGEREHSWLHLHGMAKFFRPDLEAFGVHPDVSHRALALLMFLADESLQGKPLPQNAPIAYGHAQVVLKDGAEVRPKLEHFTEEHFDEAHSFSTLVVEDGGAYASLDQLLRGAYELEPKTRAECEAEKKVWQSRLDAIRELWKKSGGNLIVRAGLEVGESRAIEHIWLDIDSWTSSTLVGRLLNDAFGDPRMVRGTECTFAEADLSGVSLLDADEVLDEVETLRTLDGAAAESLDAALTPDPESLRIIESVSPSKAILARFEDDGEVGALHLRSKEGSRALCDPLWLYNRRSSPPILDLRRLSKLGRPPLLSEVYTSQRSADEAPEAKNVEFEWESDVLRLILDGELWAVADPTSRRSWSKLITLAGRFGRPLDEVDEKKLPLTSKDSETGSQ